MQSGHPRHKQLQRAKHDMSVHNRRKLAIAILNGFRRIKRGIIKGLENYLIWYKSRENKRLS